MEKSGRMQDCSDCSQCWCGCKTRDVIAWVLIVCTWYCLCAHGTACVHIGTACVHMVLLVYILVLLVRTWYCLCAHGTACIHIGTACVHMVLLVCNMLVARVSWRMNPVLPVILSGCSQTTVTAYITQCKYCLSQTALWYPWKLYIMILCHFQAVLICLVGASVHESCSVIKVHQGLKIVWEVIGTLSVAHLLHEVRLVFTVCKQIATSAPFQFKFKNSTVVDIKHLHLRPLMNRYSNFLHSPCVHVCS
jgi:hypothetical protein